MASIKDITLKISWKNGKKLIERLTFRDKYDILLEKSPAPMHRDSWAEIYNIIREMTDNSIALLYR
jgi:hypothetical protein